MTAGARHRSGNSDRPHSRPALTLIVILYNMKSEAEQTLRSLSASYQRDIHSEQYEVIVIDNGSTEPLERSEVERWGENFRYIEIPDAAPSPGAALNLGASIAKGDIFGFIVDGARMASPGLLGWACKAFAAFQNPVCTAPAFHLGPDIHRIAVANGHSKARERELLASIRWEENGYGLFRISTLAPSSREAWLGAGMESSSLFLRRSLFDASGGYDQRFDVPGGGLLNHDFYGRLLELPGTELVSLLGEGTFHQMHGGAATGQSEERFKALYSSWHEQYVGLRGKPLTLPQQTPVCIGRLSDEAKRVLVDTLLPLGSCP